MPMGKATLERMVPALFWSKLPLKLPLPSVVPRVSETLVFAPFTPVRAETELPVREALLKGANVESWSTMVPETAGWVASTASVETANRVKGLVLLFAAEATKKSKSSVKLEFRARLVTCHNPLMFESAA
jgi:hypothetical protein